LRRYAAAFCGIAAALSLAPFAAIGARTAHTQYMAHRARLHLPVARSVPYPHLALPLEISGSQYAPVAWTDIATMPIEPPRRS